MDCVSHFPLLPVFMVSEDNYTLTPDISPETHRFFNKGFTPQMSLVLISSKYQQMIATTDATFKIQGFFT